MRYKHAFINASLLAHAWQAAKPGESHRSLKTSSNTASAGKGFDASGVGDSHTDAPYRSR